jgi:hypothetical protein
MCKYLLCLALRNGVKPTSLPRRFGAGEAKHAGMQISFDAEDNLFRDILSHLPKGSYFICIYGNTEDRTGSAVSNVPPAFVNAILKAHLDTAALIREDVLSDA